MNIEFQELIEKSGLSVEVLAELTGKSVRTVYRWENGDTPPNVLVTQLLEQISSARNTPEIDNPKFKFIDLFAGIGGMRFGFEKFGGKCVFTSEWDKHCRKTYLANFRCDHPVTGDINDPRNQEKIDDHDLLVAGFPCQPFSIAGVSKKKSLGRPHGFDDPTQGTLFFKIKEILKEKRPAAFLLENVKNLKNHDGGNTYRVISETLTDLGYHWDYKIIDAKGFVPQHRERIFIAGFRENTGFTFDNIEIPDPNSGPKLKTILHSGKRPAHIEFPYTKENSGLVSDKYTLTPHLWKYLKDYAKRQKAKGNGFGYGLFGPGDVARTLSARYYKDGSEILIKQKGNRPRRLTPRECSRLMGFDNKNRQFKIVVSDTQAYKQFGNAVVVPVVEAVAKHMMPHILKILNK